MDAFSQPNSWISQRLRAGTPTGMEGQPITQFYEDAPYDLYTDGIPQGVVQPVQYQQDSIPTNNRVLNVGRNDYNMQGTLDAEQRYGIPRVMVQSSPYARVAYTYGPSGPIPLIGATSVYPHVVSSGRYDYGAPYMAQAFAMPNDGYSFDKLMAYARAIASMQMRARSSGSGGSGKAAAKKQDTQTPTEDLALPPEGITPRGNIEPIVLNPDIPQLELPAPLTKKPDERVPVLNNPPGYYNPNISLRTASEIEAERQARSEAELLDNEPSGPSFLDYLGQGLDYLGQGWDRVKGALRNMPRNVKKGRAPEGVYPVAPEVQPPMLVPDVVPVIPETQPYLVPQQTLSSVMALPLRRRGPSILLG